MAQPAQAAVDLEGRLKRVITLPQALSVAFHQIVGAGIVALTGTAIGITAGGVPLAFLLAAVAVLIYSIPYAALTSAMPVTGGFYTYPARLFNPSIGFGTLWIFIALEAGLSVYPLTAATYVHALLPQVPVTPLAVGILCLFYVLNLLGAAISAQIGVALAVVMLAAFMTYVGFGLPQVHWHTFSNLVPNGLTGLFTAAALLTFATGGGTAAAELGGEMRKPHRDVPLAIVGGTLVAAVLYVLISLPSAGVLPIDQVANKPLTLVAHHAMPYPAYVWFIVGGAIVAVIATMNAALLWGTKSLLMAVQDGWFPRRLGDVNRRFGTPHFLITILFLVALIPILTGINIGVIASAGAGFGQLIFLAPVIGSFVMRYKFPERLAAAPFKLNKWLHLVLVVLGCAVNCYLAYLLFKSLTASVLIVLAAWILVGALWYVVWRPVRKRLQPATTSPDAASGDASRPSEV